MKISNKGVVDQVFLVVAGAISLSVGLWTVSLIFGSVNLPTNSYTVTNESMTLVNFTYVSYATQANCLGDAPLPSNCGAYSVAAVTNATTTIPASCYATSTTGLNLTIRTGTACAGNVTAGAYDVIYSYYDYTNVQSSNTFQTTQTNVFNGMVLLSVGLIVLAAGSIIAYFYGGKRGY